MTYEVPGRPGTLAVMTRGFFAEVVDPARQTVRDRVFFGATVTYLDEADTERTVTIVGIDEADMADGKISLTAPIAVALIKAKAKRGDEVAVHTPRGIETIEVVGIRYPDAVVTV